MEATSVAREEFLAIFGNTQLVNYTQRYGDYKLDAYKISLIASYCSLFLVGICGNAWVAFVIGRLLFHGAIKGSGNSSLASVRFSSSHGHHITQRPLHIYIFALCCCDLIELCFLIFLILDLFYGRWIADSSAILCQLYLSVESLNKFCGPFLLVSLSGYCYFRVCKSGVFASKTVLIRNATSATMAGGRRKSLLTPFHFTSAIVSTTSCLIVIAVCLCLMLILVTPVYLYSDVYYLILHNSTFIFSITPKCAFQPAEHILTAFTAYSFVCGYMLPAGLFTYFYCCIMMKAWLQVKMRRDREQRKESEGKLPRRDSTFIGQSRSGKNHLSRVVKTTLGLVVFYLSCWSPYWAMVVYQFTIPHDEQGQTNHTGVVLSYFVHALPYVNCCGYPILYTMLNKNIKETYRRISTGMKNEDGRLSSLKENMRIESKSMVSTTW